MMNGASTQGMSLIVKTVARWIRGFILLFGIYIVLYGHLTPGGGFAGGVIIACAFILITLAEGKKTGLKFFSKPVASELDSAGALMFLVIALLGIVFAGAFFTNFIATPEVARFQLFSGGVMPFCNIAIALKVGSSLFLVFVVLSALRVIAGKVDSGKADREEDAP